MNKSLSLPMQFNHSFLDTSGLFSVFQLHVVGPEDRYHSLRCLQCLLQYRYLLLFPLFFNVIRFLSPAQFLIGLNIGDYRLFFFTGKAVISSNESLSALPLLPLQSSLPIFIVISRKCFPALYLFPVQLSTQLVSLLFHCRQFSTNYG